MAVHTLYYFYLGVFCGMPCACYCHDITTSTILFETAVTPLLSYWNYSLVLSPQYHSDYMIIYHHYYFFYHMAITPSHDDVIKWKHFPRYWPFVRGIHRSPVNSPHKGHWRGALIFSLICVWINGWVNNREAGDLRRHRGHYDLSVMGPCLRKHLTHYSCYFQ